MEKLRADSIVKDFIKPIFGFSLNKTRRTEEAEELTNRIMIKVYETLLRKDNILDLNSYIFKLAHNVWVNYVNETIKGSRFVEINSISSPLLSQDNMEHSIIEDEDRQILRREIAYLSKVQRQIIILHYFEDKTVNEISKKLNIPTGTVKWHLSGARKDIKEGMVKVRNIGNLGINPIKFSSMGHDGNPGNLGDTSYFLGRTITQNIAYAAYHEAKTINEIAEELGVSPVFVEDEVSVLEEYGFMEKVSNNKYITNIIIDEIDNVRALRSHEIYEKYSKIIADYYCKNLFHMKDDIDRTGIYYPDNDFNYLLWSIIPYAVKEKLYFSENEKIDREEIRIPRKDGGNYIACALINKIQDLPFEDKYYHSCGDMARWSEKFKVIAWQFNTYWSDRSGWKEFNAREVELCYKFKSGQLPPEDINIDDYKLLIDKGYLIKQNDQYKLNVVWCDKRVWDTLVGILPEASQELRGLLRDLDKECYELYKMNKPRQVDKICRVWSQNSAASQSLRPYILKYLLDCNLLMEPKEHQKKTITTIMGVRG